MTYKMKKTEFTGFPFQYDKDVVKSLNEVVGVRSMNHILLEDVSKAVSPDVEFSFYDKTKDKYVWFLTTKYNINDSKVAVLFPWAQDFDNKETKMDRSINVYSTTKLSNEVVGSLLEKIASQIVVQHPQVGPDPFLKL